MSVVDFLHNYIFLTNFFDSVSVAFLFKAQFM